MKKILILLLLLPALWVSGCSQDDRADVGQAVDTLQRETGETAREAGKTLDDAGITARIKSALVASSKISAGDLNVDTRNQVVHLRGTVPDAAQIRLAEEIARNTVSERIEIVNELKVAGDEERSTTGKADQAEQEQSADGDKEANGQDQAAGVEGDEQQAEEAGR